MAGLYALTLSVIQKIRREHWGNPVSSADLENGNTKDPGLQSFVDELAFALADQGAIQMPTSLDLVAPKSGPAITINQGDNVDGGITIINNINEEVTLNFETINNITNIIETAVAGFSGSVTAVTNVSFSASISGCVVTITPTFTTKTLTFANGLCTGVA